MKSSKTNKFNPKKQIEKICKFIRKYYKDNNLKGVVLGISGGKDSAVVAAANPKFGRFDRYKTVADQIDLPAPILSRFDLTFVIEDKPNFENDRKLAQHILKTHQYSSVEYEIEPELQKQLAETEDKIAYARQFYNDTVYMYNNKCQTFPSSIFASAFGFKEADFFETAGEARSVPKVEF